MIGRQKLTNAAKSMVLQNENAMYLWESFLGLRGALDVSKRAKFLGQGLTLPKRQNAKLHKKYFKLNLIQSHEKGTYKKGA